MDVPTDGVTQLFLHPHEARRGARSEAVAIDVHEVDQHLLVANEVLVEPNYIAILGREVCYTGKHITWEQAMKSEMDLSPAKYAWGPVEVPGVAEPGKTPFA